MLSNFSTASVYESSFVTARRQPPEPGVGHDALMDT